MGPIRDLSGHEVGRSTVHSGWFILGDTLPPGRQTVIVATIGTNGTESPATEVVVA